MSEVAIRVKIKGSIYEFRKPTPDEVAEYADAVSAERKISGAAFFVERCALDKDKWRKVVGDAMNVVAYVANKLEQLAITDDFEFLDEGKEQ